LLGGGTMNVTSRWCGFSPNPAQNFRQVVRQFRAGELLVKEVPIMNVEAGGERYRAFTFGMGPVVRLLDAYEQGRKDKLAAVAMGARGLAAAWTGFPRGIAKVIAPMHATITLDDEQLAYDNYTAVFTNVTGEINPGVAPFVDDRQRDAFLCAACAVGPKELTMALPLLARGYLPPNLAALLGPGRTLEALGHPERLADPRYINRSGRSLKIESDERMYTVDGEIIHAPGNGPITVRIGPPLSLATGHRG